MLVELSYMTDETITFHSITPIFNYGILSEEFTHSGTYQDASFSISLKRIVPGKKGFADLVKNADESIHHKFKSIHTPPGFIMASEAESYLFIDVTYPYDEKYKFSDDTPDTFIIAHCILTTLRLHSSNGILFHNSHTFRYPPRPYHGWADWIRSPLTPQYSFGHLENKVSVFRKIDYDNCRNTFDILLKNNFNDKSIYKIIQLSLAYHMTTFHLQTIEHSFLILIVIFETLFKKESERNADKAAYRISKLISSDSANQLIIKEEFFKLNTHDSFCNLRNDIAHGNPNLSTSDVSIKYPILYGYITRAIIKIIEISVTDIDKSKDYYDELDKYLNSLS